MKSEFNHPEVALFRNADLSFYELQSVRLWGALGFCGNGVGQAARENFIGQDIEALVKTLGNITLICKYAEYDDDGHASVRCKQLTLPEIAQELIERRWYKIGDLAKITGIGYLREMYSDAMSSEYISMIHLMTEEDHLKAETEERRKRLEKSASEFASRNGVTFGTMEFVHEVQRHINHIRDQRSSWNSGEARMERFGACMVSGAGSDVFFDDNNFENGRFSGRECDLEEIFEWLRDQCPLLMAQYQEELLSGRFTETETVEA